MLERRTKIVATLGPATDPPGVLDALVAAGLDCARLNCSHGSHDDLRRRAADVRQVAAQAGRAIGLLFDLQGPKLRLSGATEPRAVAVGDPSPSSPRGRRRRTTASSSSSTSSPLWSPSARRS
jgi:pyruvate kinase